jgi:hypothetical protein
MATRNTFDYPSNAPITADGQAVSLPWNQWFSRVHTLVSTLNTSGTTANRPTSGLWIGRTYFDTTLNKPIWVKAVSPAVVWIDASGVVV